MKTSKKPIESLQAATLSALVAIVCAAAPGLAAAQSGESRELAEESLRINPASAPAASTIDYAKGCGIMAGAAGGGYAVGLSLDGGNRQLDITGILVSAGVGCLFGLLVGGDTVIKAKQDANTALLQENMNQQLQYNALKQRNCYMRNLCEADGITPKRPREQTLSNDAVVPTGGQRRMRDLVPNPYSQKRLESGNGEFDE